MDEGSKRLIPPRLQLTRAHMHDELIGILFAVLNVFPVFGLEQLEHSTATTRVFAFHFGAPSSLLV
jgi:hypothetical protein